jgi:hypothetical protein
MHTAADSATQQIAHGSTPLVAVLVTLLALFTGGCAMNETQQRTGTGAAIGALGGAVLGTSRESAAIGAAVGAAGGYLYDQYNKREDAQAENERLRQENERLRQQTGQ